MIVSSVSDKSCITASTTRAITGATSPIPHHRTYHHSSGSCLSHDQAELLKNQPLLLTSATYLIGQALWMEKLFFKAAIIASSGHCLPDGDPIEHPVSAAGYELQAMKQLKICITS